MTPEPSADEHTARIVERLRRDHPDPAMRAKLYADGGLADYVRVLLDEHAEPALVTRVAEAVRAAEDGSVGPQQ